MSRVVLARRALTSAYLPRYPQTKYGAFPLPWFCCHGLSGTVRRSDSRSALTHFAVWRLIGLGAPSPPGGWHPTGLTAGAETGLSCFHDGCLTIPRPLRRRVPRGCASKFFTPSMAFALSSRARLPVVPSRGLISDAAGFTSCCGLVSCTLPKRARPRATTPRSPRTPAGYYEGALVPPSAGLPPASHRELQDTRGAAPPFGSPA